MHTASDPDTQRPYSWRPLLALVGAFALGWANWRHPVLRFESPALNVLAWQAVMLLPLAAYLVSLRDRRTDKLGAFVVLAVPGLGTGLFALFGLLALAGALQRDTDASFKPVRRLAIQGVGGGSRVTLYRTNCGATCAFGLEVRHERRLAPGLLLVRPLAGWYPAYDAALAWVGPGRVRVVVDSAGRAPAPGQSAPADTLTAQLRPWVYL